MASRKEPYDGIAPVDRNNKQEDKRPFKIGSYYQSYLWKNCLVERNKPDNN